MNTEEQLKKINDHYSYNRNKTKGNLAFCRHFHTANGTCDGNYHNIAIRRAELRDPRSSQQRTSLSSVVHECM